MKMAELDAQRRSAKACVRILTLLEVVIEEVVNNGKQPANFNAIQFEMFDIARSSNASYVECREIVEWSTQLLFSFSKAKADDALATLQLLKEMMFDDDAPTGILHAAYKLLERKIDRYHVEQINASIATFIQQFIIDEEDDIVYR